MVLERIAEFLGQLLHHHDRIDERQHTMSADLKTILDKLTDQGRKLDDQGTQIAILIADRDAKEQADLDQIMGLIDANGSKSEVNAAKVAAALAPDDTGAASAGASTVTTSVDLAGGTTTAIDPTSGNTTILDHSTGDTSTVDASGATVLADPSMVSAAVQAATDAGVVVPGV